MKCTYGTSLLEDFSSLKYFQWICKVSQICRIPDGFYFIDDEVKPSDVIFVPGKRFPSDGGKRLPGFTPAVFRPSFFPEMGDQRQGVYGTQQTGGKMVGPMPREKFAKDVLMKNGDSISGFCGKMRPVYV